MANDPRGEPGSKQAIDGSHQTPGREHAVHDVEPTTTALHFRHPQPHPDKGGGADRHVHQEDPPPAQSLGEQPAGQKPDGRAARADEAEHRERSSALGLPPEEGDDHPEHDRRCEGGTCALDDPGGDELPGTRCQPTPGRRGGEDRQATEQHPPGPDEVAEAPGNQQQAAEDDQVAVHHPRQARPVEIQLGPDHGQRDRDDAAVEDDHQLARAQQSKRQPPPALHSRCSSSDALSHI